MAFVSGEHLVSIDDADAAKLPDLLLSRCAAVPTTWCLNFDYSLHSFPKNVLLSNGVFVVDKSRVYPNTDDYPFLDEPESVLSKSAFDSRIQELMAIDQTNYVVSTYSTKKTGLFSEYVVPILFGAENFSLKKTTNASPACLARLSGTVTNVIVNPQVVPLLPQITGVAYVQDMRFKEKKGNLYRNDLFYHVTNEWELSIDNPRLKEIAFQKYFLRGVESPSEPPPTGSFSIAKLVLLVVLILPIPFLYIRHYLGKKGT
ncbi:MAG TPA: hypothetical protein PLV91_05965 [Verrucomicrobiota bacterium]|nr:hypothetical protein [Verrucomicrobiota bacterium]